MQEWSFREFKGLKMSKKLSSKEVNKPDQHPEVKFLINLISI